MKSFTYDLLPVNVKSNKSNKITNDFLSNIIQPPVLFNMTDPTIQHAKNPNCHPASKVCLLMGLLSAACMLMLLLFFQYGKDQGIYSVVGRTIMEGGAPYKDAWDFKPPGIFFIYAFARLLFGAGQYAVRILEVFNFLLLTSAFAIYSRRHFNSLWPGILAGCLAIINHIQLGFWDTAQPEAFAATILAWAILFSSYRSDNSITPSPRKQTLAWILSGIFFTAASLLKPPLGGGILVSMTIVVFIQVRLLSGKNKIKKSLAVVCSYGLGAIFLLALVFAYFVQKDALKDIYETFFIFVPGYTSMEFSPQGFPILLYTAFKQGILRFSIFTTTGMIIYFLLPKRSENEIEGFVHVIGVIFFQIVGIAMQAKFFPYHYSALLPFTALLAVWGYTKLWEKIKLKWLLLLVFLIAVSWQMYQNNIFRHGTLQTKALLNPDLRCKINDTLYTVNDLNAYANRKTAEWLSQNTPEDSPIFIWGFEPVIYDMANRKSSSRYIYNIPQRAGWEKGTARRALINELRDKPPSAIVVIHNDPLPHVTGNQFDSAKELENFNKLSDFIAKDYAYVTSFEDLDIYLKKAL